MFHYNENFTLVIVILKYKTAPADHVFVSVAN